MNSVLKIKNPYLIFLPFLLFYLGYAASSYSLDFIGDEKRFFRFATHLLQGYYSPPMPAIDLLSGPGYPIILTPFVGLSIPKVYIVMLNAVMHYLSIVFLFKSLIQIMSFRKTLFFSLFWACYYLAYQNMSRIAYEPFTMFLLTALIFCLIKVYNERFNEKPRLYIFLSGFILGYIALTKVIFIPITLAMLGGCVLLWLIYRKSVNYRKAIFILLIAAGTFSPYLVYTYNLTGRAMYLGTGSDNLYWMSTPYESEYGDWKGYLTMNPIENGNYNIPGAEDTLLAHHKKDYDEIQSKVGLEKDDAYKRIATENIKAHPVKYAKNIFYNVSRIFFHYPFSQAIQRPKTLFVLPMNSIVFTFMLICLIPTLINWRRIMFPIRFMLFIAAMYLGASALVSAETRMLSVIIPLLLIWIAYIIDRGIKINLKFGKEGDT